MASERPGFENLDVWQLSRQVCRDVHPIVLDAARRRDYPLSQQLNRAALSIIANIAEGYLRRTQREFSAFLRIAAGSNAEVRALLYAALDREHASDVSIARLLHRSNQIGRMLQGLLGAVQESANVRRPGRQGPNP
jgi:four helix bundle protein